MRDVMRKMVARRVSSRRLAVEFRVAAGGARGGTIHREEFIRLVDHEGDPSERLDRGHLELIADLYSAPNGGVDGPAFLAALESQVRM